ncbi:MAG: PLP-dependent aminotransferase family protein [Kurthia sp.]|nr:PLP-dependent aminotransferase family protein [Candidatus Kurthia equi]
MDMLMFQLDKAIHTPLYEQLYAAIKSSIIERKIQTNDKLPSKRKLADFLNISQTTVELAYGQLLAEGYVLSKPRVGYFVEDIDTLAYVDMEEPSQNISPEAVQIAIDFNPGQIDTQSFPFTTWRKYMKDSIDEEKAELLLVGNAQGEYELRQEIANYLYQSRGVQCSPEQIVIGSGTEQLLPMIVQLLENEHTYAIENPGYATTHYIFKQQHQSTVSISVDDDGMDIKELNQSNATIAYVTPSHQFPTGAILSASRRVQLLNWASKNSHHYIIEDDYDSEFRYTGKPIAALQGMDQEGKVIYMSTFSKSLMPSLRIAYFVLPPKLLEIYNEMYNYYTCTVPRIDQHTLARFMQDGHFSKHLNRMRKIYRRKLEKIVTQFKLYGDKIIISGEQAGMHLMIKANHPLNALELSQLALTNSIRIAPIDNYLVTNHSDYNQHLLLGFGGIPESKISSSIDALMHAFGFKKEY